MKKAHAPTLRLNTHISHANHAIRSSSRRIIGRLVRIFDVDTPLSGLDGRYAFSHYTKVRSPDFFTELRHVSFETTSAAGWLG